MNMQKVTMTKRFYVGSLSIAASDGRAPVLKTLHEAVANGIEEVQNGHDIVYVVEVVRVIRKKPPVMPEVIIQETR